MKHRDRLINTLNYLPTDRPPFQATFTPEFANRLRIEFRLPEKQTEPHHRQWYGYDFEILTGQDAMQAEVGWFTNYYLKNIPYTDNWGVQWRIDDYKTTMGVGFYTNIQRNPLKDNDLAVYNYKAPDPNNPDIAEHIINITYNYHFEVAKNMARRGVDMIWLGDDMGGQSNLLIDPEL
jgi:uroporphyrinogen decarboxylase